MKTDKIQEEIDKQYAIFKKQVAPLRAEKEAQRIRKLRELVKKHKGIIYTHKDGRDYVIYKVLKGLNKKGRLKYTRVIVEHGEESSIYYIKERKKVKDKEAILDIVHRLFHENKEDAE